MEIKKQITRVESEQRIATNNLKNITTIEEKIKEQLDSKVSIYDFVTTFVDEIIVSKVGDDRKDIILDIYLNFNRGYSDNKRGSKVKRGEVTATKLSSDVVIESLETDKRKTFVMNKFKYNVYMNQE